ncbi:MAG: DUF3524 domain-containing protein [Planctomycetota bacterium]|nr:DUF3524 domain-containing protein [Planctomycetota bacterium]
MRILALEPYYGGSHRAFLDGWSQRSRHHWTLLTLPAHHWKWRMRHSAVTLRAQIRDLGAPLDAWDLVWCSDMLNLAEFKGLLPPQLAKLPVVAYFHENQLTYPVQVPDARDLHFGITNFMTALAADEVWFNSTFHQDDFLSALDIIWKQMPDRPPRREVMEIRKKACVFPPAVAAFPRRGARLPGPLQIVWAARWEHDKDPDTLFAALAELIDRKVNFHISVLGQSFRDTPAIFADAQRWLASHIKHWGFLSSADYRRALGQADVFVSTAQHEFFGISAVEAMTAGTFPVLPNRLAYPELLTGLSEQHKAMFLYDGTAAQLAHRLETLAGRLQQNRLWEIPASKVQQLAQRFQWTVATEAMDDALERLSETHQERE